MTVPEGPSWRDGMIGGGGMEQSIGMVMSMERAKDPRDGDPKTLAGWLGGNIGNGISP